MSRLIHGSLFGLRRVLISCAAGVLLAPAGVAQTPDGPAAAGAGASTNGAASPGATSSATAPQTLDYRFMMAAAPCTRSGGQPAMAPQDAISACQGAIEAVNALRTASPGLTRHEDNIYLFEMMLMHTTIASRMGVIDGSRSARVCGEMEKSWGFASRIVPAESPQNYATDLTAAQEQSVGLLRLCRREFGAPATAPPLP